MSGTVVSGFVKTMKTNLADLITEKRNPNSKDLDLKSGEEIVAIFAEENRNVIAAVEAESMSIVRGVELITAAFQRNGRLFYVGAGTSGRLGVLDASECPPTFGTEPDMVQGVIAGGDTALRQSVETAEDEPCLGARAIRKHGVTDRDVVVGIASSGRTPYVLGALTEAHRVGANTILLCCVPPPDFLDEFVNLCIAPVVGPEIITGSTRLKAGTATKLVLNMLSTISMIKIAKVYDNLMVDVQTSNSKLVDRGTRIIMAIVGTDFQTAKEALVCANGSVKVAVVMLVRGVDRKQAVERLKTEDDVLRRVLEQKPLSGNDD